jgi:hypothetical protein
MIPIQLFQFKNRQESSDSCRFLVWIELGIRCPQA